MLARNLAAADSELTALPLTRERLQVWRSLHRDDGADMYALPEHDDELFAALERCHPFLVRNDRSFAVIACFTLTPAEFTVASCRLIIAPQYRGQGMAGTVIALIERTARTFGFTALRAEVNVDNAPALAALRSEGFRQSVLLEKNIGCS